MNGSAASRLDDRLLRPDAGDEIIGSRTRPEQIHGDHRKLQRRAPLQKQNVVVVGNARQLAAQGFAFFVDRHVGFTTVRMFHDADARRAEAQQVFAGLLEDFDRQDCRSGREIVNAMGHESLPFRN